MNQNQWTVVDDYIVDLFGLHDPILEAALRSSADAGLPAIQVTPNQGRMLAILVQAVGACKILEIGTLGGYSAINMARALPEGGCLISLEASQKHADVARANIERAGLSDVIEVRVAPAQESLPKLVEARTGPFDLIFIDADKPSTAVYFDWALKLSHPGTMIIVDNAIRHGDIIDAASADPNVQGMRAANAAIAASPRVTATLIQTVGSKGYDGFTVALVKN